jgi:uncharacterized protein YfaS (alpha-2-macroglobulin family)
MLQVKITTDKPEYRPGEKAVYHVKTLTPDEQPVSAEVSLGVVDESIYAIAPEDTTEIGAFFYPKRLQDVQTAFSFPSVYLSGDSKEGVSVSTRKNFLDTAYWNPSVVTDANGDATFTVTMPDNLTTWRATCRAATLDTRVGQATEKTTVTQPFMVRLEAPRFVTQGDSVTFSAVVNNQTKETLSADIGIDAKGFAVKERNPQSIRVEPGKSARADWTVSGFKLGSLPVRVWSKAGSYADAMESSLPVYANGKDREVARSGAVDSSESFSLDMPNGTIPDTEKLTIRLTPSVASAMLGSLDYLASYPYGCVEQTMSSFLPDVMLSRMLKTLNLSDPDLEKRLPNMVQSGLLRLYGYQKDDGSWGWWEYDKPDAWMTAYAIFGLQEAKAAGFPVSEDALNRGVKALAGTPDYGRAPNDDVQAWMAYVLARAGQTDAANKRLAGLVDAQGRIYRDDMGYGDRAILALALAKSGREAQGAAILDPAWNRTVEGKAKSIYEGPDRNESDALLLYAATQMTPDDPRIPNLIRDLLTRRQANHWDSTRDTAFILYGLIQYLPRSGDLNPDMDAKVIVDGKVVASRRFTKADATKPETVITLDSMTLGTGSAAVRVEKTGTGRLYYTARLESASSENLMKPVVDESGLSVERSYRLYRRGSNDDGNDVAQGLPAGATVRFKSGDILDVTLILRTKRPLDYAMVEDHFPAGCEPQDRGQVTLDEWTNWWAEQVTRDQKVGFAIPHLDPGVERITYRLFARTPGVFAAPPPVVYDMYRPEATRGEGVEQTVVIQP